MQIKQTTAPTFKQGVIRVLTFCSLATFLIIPLLTAQNTIHIKGRVVNESGQPVPKATVQVKNSKTAVTTDDSGNYEITAALDAMLVVSSVGYTSLTLRVAGRSVPDAVLHASPNSLDQVVVVGYGTQKKKDVTGSIVSVSAKTLSEVPASNMGLALQGRAAGWRSSGWVRSPERRLSFVFVGNDPYSVRTTLYWYWMGYLMKGATSTISIPMILPR